MNFHCYRSLVPFCKQKWAAKQRRASKTRVLRMSRVNDNFSFLYCERQVSRLNALTLRLPSRSPSGNKPSLANHGDEFAQDLHPLPFSPDAYGLTPYAFIQLCLMPNYSSIPIVSCQCRGKNEICVCVHLTQTRYAQKVCAEMRGKMEYDFRNVVTDGKCEK